SDPGGLVEGGAVSRRQPFGLAPAATLPDRADGVDDEPGGQVASGGGDGAAGRDVADASAPPFDGRAAGGVDRPADAAARGEMFVGGVDDGVDRLGRDVALDRFDVQRESFARIV